MAALPIWIRIAGGLGVVWYLTGTIGYLGSLGLTREELNALPLASQEVLALRPAWLTPVALISLGTGLLGSIGLVVGRRWAAPTWVVSLLTNVPYAYFALVPGEAYRRFGLGSVVIQIATLCICGAYAWLAHVGRRRGWLV
jgi:hypothetical protein